MSKYLGLTESNFTHYIQIFVTTPIMIYILSWSSEQEKAPWKCMLAAKKNNLRLDVFQSVGSIFKNVKNSTSHDSSWISIDLGSGISFIVLLKSLESIRFPAEFKWTPSAKKSQIQKWFPNDEQIKITKPGNQCVSNSCWCQRLFRFHFYASTSTSRGRTRVYGKQNHELSA